MILILIIKGLVVRMLLGILVVSWGILLLLLLMVNPTADLTKMQLMLAKISRDTEDLYKHGGE